MMNQKKIVWLGMVLGAVLPVSLVAAWQAPASVAPAASGAAPAAAAVTTATTGTREPEGAAEALGFENAVAIGASVSAGFATTWSVSVPPAPDAPPGTPPVKRQTQVTLADALAAIAGPEAAAPASFADGMFFMRPDIEGDRQITAALDRKPTLVFALDFLFWFSYGSMPDEARAGRFEKGLARLETLLAQPGVKMVIGDLPDMSMAVGLMLSKRQVPSPEVLTKLNQRLREWVREHKNAVIVPLTEFVPLAKEGKRVKVGGREYEGEAATGLFATDRLHATAPGIVAIAEECLDRLKEAGLIGKNVTWEHDPKVVLDRLHPKVMKQEKTQPPPGGVSKESEQEHAPAGGK